ncbi:hypothetical protein CC1G_13877 [Coprinopsis cinerea okayama7|uniref:Uncharacterized protein n=1 Tax=Coprinopsis cinerea (strain Okayama-7 / 130 / ATCC MYA-4618 / FGSC 9003) TaxID=240176 RepID=D6RKL5_COPC7|nr:hypothetical protein CC1G_13877 [Coprinopsis cinerea okayama7\|eukprot:XP_002911841.1 hypothetical protein CC1G_13877 [Coprinopsis cinerea okayama7\
MSGEERWADDVLTKELLASWTIAHLKMINGLEHIVLHSLKITLWSRFKENLFSVPGSEMTVLDVNRTA